MPCQSEQPVGLSPRHRTVLLYPKSDEEGSWVGRPDTRSEIRGQKHTVRETDYSLFFFVSLPQMSGLPKECLRSEITDFCLKQQRTMENILYKRI